METNWKWKPAGHMRHKRPLVGGCLHAWCASPATREWRWKVVNGNGDLLFEGRAAFFADAKKLAEQAWQMHLARAA